MILGQYKLFWTEKKNPNASCIKFQNSSLIPRNQTFNFAILDNLERVLGSAMTQDHKLAKPNQTKPNQDILGPFLGLFDPFLVQKNQKTTVT